MSALDAFYNTVVRRNSIYVGFIIAGAFVGERAVDSAFQSMWESNNKNKLYKDLPCAQTQ